MNGFRRLLPGIITNPMKLQLMLLRMKVLNLITSPDEVYQTVFNLSTAEKKK